MQKTTHLNCLGKTIEAGIILSQNWAEHKRRLLIICPANLRKQWSSELLEKFFLPSVILETESFKTQFSHNLEEEDYADLRSRLQPICKRTLRSREIPEGFFMIFDGPDKKIKYF